MFQDVCLGSQFKWTFLSRFCVSAPSYISSASALAFSEASTGQKEKLLLPLLQRSVRRNAN